MKIERDITEYKSMYELFVMLKKNERKEPIELQFARWKKDRKK